MLSRSKIFITFLMLLSLPGIKCSDRDSDRYNCAASICTEEFRTIVLTIKHSSDNTPFILTDYRVIRIPHAEDITPASNSNSTNNGYYPVANDSQKELFMFMNVEILFKGYLNNDLVVQKRFIVTADCCHISLVDGETSIYL
jgi:hypothetical protein